MSKTNNPKVLELYGFIKRNENSDSDYWSCGGGDEELIFHLDYYFTDTDWKDLEADLINWPIGRLELFAYCIMNGISYSPDELVRIIKEYGTENTMISWKGINRRFELILPLLEIDNDSQRRTNDITIEIYQNFDFVEVHFDLLTKGINNFIPKLEKIMKLLGREQILAKYPLIKSKLEAL